VRQTSVNDYPWLSTPSLIPVRINSKVQTHHVPMNLYNLPCLNGNYDLGDYQIHPSGRRIKVMPIQVTTLYQQPV
jgi:hypothetical protein